MCLFACLRLYYTEYFNAMISSINDYLTVVCIAEMRGFEISTLAFYGIHWNLEFNGIYCILLLFHFFAFLLRG